MPLQSGGGGGGGGSGGRRPANKHVFSLQFYFPYYFGVWLCGLDWRGLGIEASKGEEA